MTVGSEQIGMRLDVFVSSYLEVTRSGAQGMIENGLVSVNGRVESKIYRLR